MKPTSDIDILLTTRLPTYRIEVILDEAHESILHKKLVQATPNDVIKAIYELEDVNFIGSIAYRFYPFSI